jgi:hypothetical protein
MNSPGRRVSCVMDWGGFTNWLGGAALAQRSLSVSAALRASMADFIVSRSSSRVRVACALADVLAVRRIAALVCW